MTSEFYAQFRVVACPYCGAAVGENCRNRNRQWLWAVPHAQRIRANKQPGTGDQVHNRKESE